MRCTRLVIADRYPVVLHGLTSVFGAQRDFKIVASCHDGMSSIEAIRSLAPDVAILDVAMPDLSGLQILAIANAEKFATRLVFYTASNDHVELATAGAWSVISKETTLELLLQSLRRVVDGRKLLPLSSPELVPPDKQRDRFSAENVLAALTDREREIMRLVAQGWPNKSIARRLNISHGTIKVHLHHIYQKLEISNRTALAALAISSR
jgi:two-component system nitrate/nitrite response regulator NarL